MTVATPEIIGSRRFCELVHSIFQGEGQRCGGCQKGIVSASRVCLIELFFMLIRFCFRYSSVCTIHRATAVFVLIMMIQSAQFYLLFCSFFISTVSTFARSCFYNSFGLSAVIGCSCVYWSVLRGIVSVVAIRRTTSYWVGAVSSCDWAWDSVLVRYYVSLMFHADLLWVRL